MGPSRDDKLPVMGTLILVLVPLFVVGFPLYIGIPALRQYVDMKPRSYVPPGWLRTSGLVVGNHEHGTKFFYWDPVITFEDASGAPVKFVANADHNGPVPEGSEVPVAYSPRDPHQAEYVGEPGSPQTTALVIGIIMTTVGFLFAVGVVLIIIYLRRDDRRHKEAAAAQAADISP